MTASFIITMRDENKDVIFFGNMWMRAELVVIKIETGEKCSNLDEAVKQFTVKQIFAEI